eukprot:61103-Rhodomonas_salina.3
MMQPHSGWHHDPSHDDSSSESSSALISSNQADRSRAHCEPAHRSRAILHRARFPSSVNAELIKCDCLYFVVPVVQTCDVVGASASKKRKRKSPVGI